MKFFRFFDSEITAFGYFYLMLACRYEVRNTPYYLSLSIAVAWHSTSLSCLRMISGQTWTTHGQFGFFIQICRIEPNCKVKSSDGVIRPVYEAPASFGKHCLPDIGFDTDPTNWIRLEGLANSQSIENERRREPASAVFSHQQFQSCRSHSLAEMVARW